MDRRLENDWLHWQTAQNIACDLANPAFFGNSYIEGVLDLIHTNHDVLEYAQLFLLVVSHSALLDCFSVRAHVDDVYRVISGNGGERAVLFLTHFCNALLEEILLSCD